MHFRATNLNSDIYVRVSSNYSTSVSQVDVHYAVFAYGIYPPFHCDGGFLVHPSGDAVYSGAIALIRRAH